MTKLIHLIRHYQCVGVFSLSEDPTNMLMWSHYGSNHEGIAIDFEENGKLKNEEYCLPVKYEKNLPKVDITKGIMNGVSFFLEVKDHRALFNLKIHKYSVFC